MPRQDAAAEEAAATILKMLPARATGATICPSEVARAIFATIGSEYSMMSWRSAMPAVHAAVDQLVAAGTICLSWKGAPLARRSGPYRIRHRVLSGPVPLE